MTEMFMKPSFVFDMICLALVLILALVYAHKGLVATLVQLVGTLGSLVGAKLLADWASPLVFTRFLRQSFLERVQETLAAGGTVDLQGIAQKFAGFLPQSLIDSIVQSVQQPLNEAMAQNAATVAQDIVDQVIAPLFTPVVSIVLFFVTFALLRMAVGLLVGLLVHLNKLPVLGTVNRGLGFGVGLLVGVVDLFLALCALWALIVVTGGGLPYINDAQLSGSVVYTLFGQINPFV